MTVARPRSVAILAFPLLLLALIAPASAQPPRQFDGYYDLGASPVNRNEYAVAITRQSSCSVILKQFLFAEPKSGAYVVQLKIAFQGPLPDGTLEDRHTIMVLFNDVVQTLEATRPIKLSLSNKALATGVPLARITNAHVEVRLVRVKDSFNRLLKRCHFSGRTSPKDVSGTT